MKILMISAKFHPHVGGVEKHLWELLTKLISRGHQCELITDRYSDELPVDETINLPTGILPVHRIKSKRRTGILFPLSKIKWSSFVDLFNAVKRNDIIHCHDFGVFIFWYLPLRVIFPRKKVFITFHGWEGVFPPERKIIILRKITEYLTHRNICIGEFICKWYGTKADSINYGGVSLPKDMPVNNNRGGAVFVGRLASDTGIQMYLEALHILKNKGINIKLTVCGDGPLKEKCISFTKQHKLDVCFLGFQKSPEDQLQKSSYAFVSGYLAILEAMSLKNLVFSVYDNPLKEDYLRLHPGNKDMMFVAGTAIELAEQLLHSILNVQRSEMMLEKAFLWSQNKTWETVADTYEQLWGCYNS